MAAISPILHILCFKPLFSVAKTGTHVFVAQIPFTSKDFSGLRPPAHLPSPFQCFLSLGFRHSLPQIGDISTMTPRCLSSPEFLGHYSHALQYSNMAMKTTPCNSSMMIPFKLHIKMGDFPAMFDWGRGSTKHP